MRTNAKVKPIHTHEGAIASRVGVEEELRRTLMSCLLWEDGFYEAGALVSDRLKSLVAVCEPNTVADLAIEARKVMRLRHAPLFVVRELARRKSLPARLVSDTLYQVIDRADELSEFLAMYWADGKQPLTRQVKDGLARAFTKFNAYQLAKYNQDSAIKLRDVLFMVHAKPKDEDQAATWKKLVDGTLEAPDTWEVALSAGSDKKETFERLISEGKLGYMALLRNLRNMNAAGVDATIVRNALMAGAEKSKALPFRYIAAARAVPSWEPMVDEAMQVAMGSMPKMPGRTVIMVDVSGSMDDKLSAKSDLKRIDAACALAILVRGICDDVEVITFSNSAVIVPPRKGMALADAINRSQPHSGTYLGKAVKDVVAQVKFDRIIVITDEQSADAVPAAGDKAYMINVATNKNGVGYGPWTHVHGFSEAIIGYIQALERVER